MFDQSYTYDSLNRLKSAEEVSDSLTTWKQVYTFDRYGNRNFDEEETTTLVKNCGTDPNFTVCAADKKVFNPDMNPANNRMASGQDWTYDAAGNVTVDAEGRQFIYDAENKQKEVKNSINDVIGQYFFDGDGKRVKKIVPSTGEVTIFVYDAGAKLIGEYSTVLSQDPKAQYLTSDHLGSPRVNTDQDGLITSRTDYMPYGEEIIGLGNRTSNENYVTDDVRQGFTGYENDPETGLDYAQARMYANDLGRFTSIDPIIMAKERLRMPQRLNLYIYTTNNPLNFTDPTGEDVAVNGSDSDITLYENDLNKRLEKSKLKVKVVDGKLTVVGKVPKNLKGDALKIVQAIRNKDKTANISLVRNDGQVDFGSAFSLDKDGNLSTSNQRIDYAELGILNSAKIDGYDSSVVAMHETLEAIGIQIDGKSKDDAHKYAGDLGYPGLSMSITGAIVPKPDDGSYLGFQYKYQVEGTNTTFTADGMFSKPFTPAPGQKGPKTELDYQKFRATSPLNITRIQK